MPFARLTDMRKMSFAQNEYYHIFNRGNNKQNIFLDDGDRARFLLLLLFFQCDLPPLRINKSVADFIKNQHRVLDIFADEVSEIASNRYVALESFALMPNHFHLMLREAREGGISQYMQRVLNSFTKYANTKYEKSGHLFQGPFKAVRIEDNKQLLYLSAYIHRNPREMDGWHNREHRFPWSSYSDYISHNRWGPLLEQDVILSQFTNKSEYYHFVKTSAAKLLKEELDKEIRLD